MFNSANGYSLSDIAAASGNEGFGGQGGAWWIIILFLFCFMGGAGNGFWGNNNRNAATTEDVQNQFNFAALERQNNETVAAVRQASYDVTGAVKDMGYMNGNQIRDVESMVQANGYELSKGFCGLNQNIDSIRYDNALNTKELLASNCAQTQKILDAINGNRIADMQNQINALQLQSALCGVMRYPTATTYSAGYAPMYYGNPGCGCGN